MGISGGEKRNQYCCGLWGDANEFQDTGGPQAAHGGRGKKIIRKISEKSAGACAEWQ